MKEQAIQKKITTELTKQGYFVIKLISTNKSGIPDLLAIKDGKAKFIEVKRPEGKLSKLQEYRIRELESFGAECHVWVGFEKEFKKK